MGRIDLGKSGYFPASHNTKFEVARDVTPDGVRAVLERLSTAPSLADDRVCYVHGKGAKTRSDYVALRRTPGISVVWFRSVLPPYIRFLKVLIPSYEGLVRIDDLSRLARVFTQLMHLSSVGVYCVRQSFEPELLRLAGESGRPRREDLGTKADPAYVFYIVDADNAESRTGMIEIISHGIETPIDMVPYT